MNWRGLFGIRFSLCAGMTVSKAMYAVVTLCAATALADNGKNASMRNLAEPVVTYWAGPDSFMPLNDRTAAQLRAGGWNVGWTKTPEGLDIYDRYGMRAILEIGMPDVDNPAQETALKTLIETVKTHRGLYAYYLNDEPGTGAFPKLAKLVAWLRKRDANHPAFINLLPTYATSGQLSVSDDAAERSKVGIPQDFAGIHVDDKAVLRYREYLRQFIDVVRPELLSYDHYHFNLSGDGTQYFTNLAMIRSAALEAKIPFWNIIQACGSPGENLRVPNENELRWLTYTSLAYGAQGICHFRYDIGFWQDPKHTSVPLSIYWPASEINREFSAIAAEILPLLSLGVFHGGTIPAGGVKLPANAPFATEPPTQDVVLGMFGNSASENPPTHVVVVNRDYKNGTTVTLTGRQAMEQFHAPSGVWLDTVGGKRIELDLPPGGGALVRLKVK